MALKAWYPFNGNINNLGCIDARLTQTAAPTFVNGKMGKSLNQGGFKWTAEQTEQILNEKEVSICFGVYIDLDEGSTSNRAMFFGNDAMDMNGGRQFSLFNYPTSNDLHGSGQNCVDDSYSGGSGVFYGVIPSRKWTHIAVTYKNPKITFYINGEQIGTGTFVYKTDGFYYDTQVIGNNAYHKFNDYRVYDECLSKKEVKELAKGLCLHYKFSTPKAIDNLVRYEDLRGFGEGTSGTDYRGSLVQLNETFNKAKVYRLTYTPLTQIALTPLQTEMYQQGVVTLNERTWLANTKYIYYFLYRPITNTDTTAGLDPELSFTSNWIGRRCTDTIGDGRLGTVYRDGTIQVEQTSKNGIGIKVPSAELNESVIVDFCGAHLIEGTDQIIPEFDYEGTTLDYEGDCSGFGYTAPSTGILEYDDNSVKYQGSTNFSNGGYYQNIKNPLHSDSDEFTISCGFYPTQNSNMALFNDRTTTEDGVSVFYLEGGIRFDTGTAAHYQVGTLTLNKGNHITCVYKKNAYKKVYINGVLVGTSTNMGSLNNIGENASIGNSSTNGDAGAGNQLYGNLSDFRIYATALSDKDILTLYRNRAGVDKKQVVYASEFKEAFDYEN